MHQMLARASAILGIVVVAACSDIAPPTSPLSPLSGPSAGKQPKVQICHAAGLASNPKYILITPNGNGINGHFLNNGTPKAGHELDFLVDEAHPCNAPAGGQLQLCVNLNPGTIGDPAVPGFVSTFSVGSVSLPIVSPTLAFSYAVPTNSPVTLCSDVFDVPPDTYSIAEPAPGITDPPPPDNGTWYIASIGATIDGNTTIITSVPSNGTTWDALTGRGQNGSADAVVQSNSLTVVTFYLKK